MLHRILTRVSRYPLASLLSLTVVCWLPYFSSRVVPFHDSAYIYECFHAFYSDALFAGELTRWIPYGSYGMQADLAQCAFPPTASAVAAGGLLCRATGTLVLFKMAILLCESLYAFGLYLLSRELYSRKLTQFLVVMIGVLSISWLEQEFLNLMVFYLFPLVLHGVIRFFKTGNVRPLLLAGLIEVCSVIGGVPYFAPLHAYVLAVIAIPLCLQYPQALRSLMRPVTLIQQPYLWGMLAAAAVIVGVLGGGLDNLLSLAPGRDPATGHVTLDTFLNYGRLTIATTLFGFVTGGMPHGDNTYYVGLLSLPLFTYGLVTSRDKVCLGIASALGMLCWLSIGGQFTTAIYHLPGMVLFRHIGLVFGIAGMLLLLGAGFGIDRVACLLAGIDVPRRACLWKRCCWLGLAGGLMIADLWFNKRPNDLTLFGVNPNWQPFFAVRLFVCLTGVVILLGLVRAGKSWQRLAPAPALVLALTCLLDMASFRVQVYWTMPSVSPSDLRPGVFEADRIPYLPQRSQQPQGELASARWQALMRPIAIFNNQPYTVCYEFLRMDPCRPVFRTDLLAKGTSEMIQARGGVLAPHPTEQFLPPHDEAFKAALGCDAPKLRLVQRAKIARTEADARQLFALLPDPATTVVLLSDDPQIVDSLEEGDPLPSNDIQVSEFTSNRINIKIDVSNAKPAWLVYADSWHPGWKARLDGRDVPIIRANLGFKAVRVGPGAHDVEFAFKPRRRTAWAWCHMLIAVSFGMGLCVAMIAALVREYRGPSQTGSAPSQA